MSQGLLESRGKAGGGEGQIQESLDHIEPLNPIGLSHEGLAELFGDHRGCRDYEIEDEDGNVVTRCGFHRVGPDYKFTALKNGEALDPVFKKKINNYLMP